MGRSVGDIYDSSAAMNYVSTITDRLDRELIYWFSPEKVLYEGGWLAQALSVIEIVLLFEAHNIGSTIYIDEPKVVQRWRETFFTVWDGDWKREDNSRYIYNDPAYRLLHRPGIISLFDRLESIAREWVAIDNGSVPPELKPLLPDYPLPYFSISRWINAHNKQIVQVERFTSYLIEFLVKDIIYYLSREKRAEVIGINVQEVWVAVDVLAFLCATYEQSPGVNEQVVRNWRQETIDIWKQFTEDDKRDWDESDRSYQEVMGVFDRLETVARQYPLVEW